MKILSFNHLIIKLFSMFLVAGMLTPGYANVEIEEWRKDDNWRKGKSEKVWVENLKPAMFADKKIIEDIGQSVLEIKAPIRAEDATIVPISIHTKFQQTKQRYIKKITVLIDKNPVPLVGEFAFGPASGKADLAMRLRIDDFTYVRAIAELNNGEYFMVKTFIRAKGACSAPPPKSAAESLRLMGKMKIKTIGDLIFGKPNLVQLKILHPNVTGLAYDPVYNSRPPPHYLQSFNVKFNDELIMKANITFAISQDPAFRFYFKPEKDGTITIEASDTKENSWSASHNVVGS